jgi:hypothetical protein
MDEVRYNSSGNEVTMIKRRDPTEAAEAAESGNKKRGPAGTPESKAS